MDLADLAVILVPADLKDGFRLMVELRPDMSTDVVIGLVQMQDGMDVKVVLACPSHQQTNHFRRLS